MKQLGRRIKNTLSEHFSKRMKSDFYGPLKQIWRCIRPQRREVYELMETVHIDEATWIEYLTKLYTSEEDTLEAKMSEIRTDEYDRIGVDQVQQELKKLKNRKLQDQMVSSTNCLITTTHSADNYPNK